VSHFKVLVIGEEPEKQLAPYDESISVEPYRDYEKGQPTDHWAFEKLSEENGLTADSGWAGFVTAWNVRWGADEAPMCYDAESDRAYQTTTYNPKSKWDWYSLGGRYLGALIVKQGALAAKGRPGTFNNDPRHPGGVDQARVKDIDWSAMRAAQRKLAEDQLATMRQHMDEKFTARNLVWDMSDEDIAATLADPEPWINIQSAPFTCFAVIKNGEWAEKGRMGWFGMTADEMTDMQWQQKLSELLANLDGETLLTVVDCHI